MIPVPAALAVLVLAACAVMTHAPIAPEAPSGAGAVPGAVATPTPVPADPLAPPVSLTFHVVTRRPHATEAFTQGLVFDGGGRLFESTGLLGRSSLRELDAQSGATLRAVALPDDHFGEGLAIVDDRLIQLTWRNGVAHVWDADTFAPLGSFSYHGEGWGLCYDGHRLVMSDGSARLTFRDPDTFEILGEVVVREAGQTVPDLNELECMPDAVWANVYGSDRIVRIDPVTGRVSGSLDLSGILLPHPRERRAGAVLNGIAYDRSRDTFIVTGKLWPELIEIRVHPPPSAQLAQDPPASPLAPTFGRNPPGGSRAVAIIAAPMPAPQPVMPPPAANGG